MRGAEGQRQAKQLFFEKKKSILSLAALEKEGRASHIELISFFLSAARLNIIFFFSKKKYFLPWFFVPGIALAQSAPIEALNAGLAQAEKTGKAPFQQRFDALAPVVDHAFNLSQILQTIVGLRWSQIPADQQAKLLAAFRAFTVSSYVSNFNAGSDSFKILPETRTVGSDTVVETQIVPPAGDPTRIDYVMRQGPAGWQAVDVLQQGTISQAAVQRSDFRAELNNGGAPALIDSLQKKVAAMGSSTAAP
jgi:phospholipid transport system substrate-binding protein